MFNESINFLFLMINNSNSLKSQMLEKNISFINLESLKQLNISNKCSNCSLSNKQNQI